ncbi:MAG: pilus assembly protein, partial [Alphaproteobacteria bacterium]|nr:pilus assembly protein [Alphaproteobacteria bacterium]
MLKHLKKFRSDEDGNVAIIFGFAIVPFLIAAGMAVDYGRGVVAKHELQVALDTAVLAAGSLRLADDQDRKALGKAFFEANFNADGYGMTVPSDLISINNNVISADESLSVDTAFMQLSSMLSGQTVDEMQLQSDATALVPQVGTAEISLILDYSGSMDDYLNGAKKYVTMRNAAKDLINSLHTASGSSSSDIKFSLVPFSYGVKAS